MNQVSDLAASAHHGRRKGSWPKKGLPWLAVGALLAGTTLANHLVAKRSERRHPPQGKFVEVDGVQVHFLERGVGPTLVLIHGNGVTAQDYELSGLLDRLAQRQRVIAFDRPGFGYTARPRSRSWSAHDQAKLILGAMTALDVTKATIVGHSWGTLVALEAALQEPHRIDGLVLMSGYYWPTLRLDVPLLSGPAIPGLGDLLRFTVSPLLGWAMTPLVMKQIFSPSKVPANFQAGFQTSMSLRPSQLRATAADTMMMAREAAKTSGRHKEIAAPVLVMVGDGDKIVRFQDQSRRLGRELLDGQIHVVQGAGHMIHHGAPDEVATGIETFVDRIGARQSAEGPQMLDAAPTGDIRPATGGGSP